MGAGEKEKSGFWKSLFRKKPPSYVQQQNGKPVNSTQSFCCLPRQVTPLSILPPSSFVFRTVLLLTRLFGKITIANMDTGLLTTATTTQE